MAIILCGGSNTLSRDGWVKTFRDLVGDNGEIVNLSIGAAPSHMAAYRLASHPQLREGDTVIWEYGMNDPNHIEKKGYQVSDFRDALGWIARICRENGCKLGLLIFQPRKFERLRAVSDYRKMLHRFCEEFGIPFFDVPQEFSKRFPRAERIPPRYFRNNLHYEKDTDIMTAIAEGAVDLVGRATVPDAGVMDSFSPLLLCRSFQKGLVERVSNSLVSVDAWVPKGEFMEARTPVPGRLIGLVVVATRKGGAFEVISGNQRFRVSATFKEKNFGGKSLLKFIHFRSLVQDPIELDVSVPLRIGWAESAEGIVSDVGFRSRLDSEILAAREARLVDCLIEGRG